MLALSIGCPSGIGPEVSVRALADKATDVLLVGDFDAIVRAVSRVGLDRPVHQVSEKVARSQSALARAAKTHALLVYQPTKSLTEDQRELGVPTPAGGRAQLAWVKAACELARSGVVSGMVTGPVSKEAVVRGGGKGFIGHTEYLAKLCGVRDVTMAFAAESFTSALVTTHMALADVPRAVTARKVATTIVHLAGFLNLISRKKRPKIVVSGLNPHAGENGQFGREEQTRIIPAMARASSVAELLGPLPVEHAFRLAQKHAVDGVVAMYHDQATLAMKLLSFGEAVNVTLGLPIIRTSVDHGTAYDLAPSFAADASGMEAALALARRMTQKGTRRR
jgi:4-hydroxythreonine-4-phosphate dehydrogenase